MAPRWASAIDLSTSATLPAFCSTSAVTARMDSLALAIEAACCSVRAARSSDAVRIWPELLSIEMAEVATEDSVPASASAARLKSQRICSCDSGKPVSMR